MNRPKDIQNFSAEEMTVLLNSFDTVMTDCDGVLWFLNTPIPGALESLKTLQSLGKRVLFVSNNSFLLVEDYIVKLRKMGFEATPEQIVIPSSVILWYLRKIKFQGKALVMGTMPFIKVLQDGGIDVITSPTTLAEDYALIPALVKLDPAVRAVIFDFDANLSWTKMYLASLYLAQENVIYLTGALDRDLVFGKDLRLLGIGQFSDILVERTGNKPIECAKPSEQLQHYLIEKLEINDPKRCIFIGDSLSADMKFAQSCGFKKLWVGSGLDKIESCEAQNTPMIADYYLSDLGALNSLIKKSRTNEYNQRRTQD
ncbi:4-nitrophenylphosphatase [Diachasma alloeum]|uniref:4-nitrophenylphosphatase n=1 Tax=Diachasma alloeum TaxID=454923 RepID=UPI0007383CA2|nr:4-nitrophenylphosphatase [Diachasma alloeum]